MKITMMPPAASWSATMGASAGVAAGTAPKLTKTKASTKLNANPSSFCVPWNRIFPFSVVRSHGMTLDPTSNWMMMEAVTIGPIPRLMMEPKLEPSSTSRNRSCSNPVWLTP